jgi:hypothetical protein
MLMVTGEEVSGGAQDADGDRGRGEWWCTGC